MELGTLSVKCKAELRELETGLARGGQMVKGYSAKVEGYLRTHAASFRRLAQVAVVAVAAAGAAISKLVKDAIIYGEQMNKLSLATGIGAEAMGKLGYAAEQEHGSLEGLAKSLPILAKYSAYAAQGMETYKREFDKMGVSVTDASGKLRNIEDIFLDMSDFFATSPQTDTEKLAIAMTLLGRRGMELIPFMKLGKAEMQKLGEEAVRLGIVLSDEDAAAMKQFGDSLVTVKGAVRGVGISIAKDMIPDLKAIADWVSENLPTIKEEFRTLAKGVRMIVAPTVYLAMGFRELGNAGLFLYRTNLQVMRISAQMGNLFGKNNELIKELNRDIAAATGDIEKNTNKNAKLLELLDSMGKGYETVAEKVRGYRKEVEDAEDAQKSAASSMASEFIGAFEWKPSAMFAGGGREFGSKAPVVSQRGGSTVLQLTVNVDTRAGLHRTLDRELDKLNAVN
jgi:hypothetical protein